MSVKSKSHIADDGCDNDKDNDEPMNQVNQIPLDFRPTPDSTHKNDSKSWYWFNLIAENEYNIYPAFSCSKSNSIHSGISN